MEATEASVTGTLRIIGILLLVWFVLRLIQGRMASGQARRRAQWNDAPLRPKGDVRIEPAAPEVRRDARDAGHAAPRGSVSDAEYEELK